MFYYGSHNSYQDKQDQLIIRAKGNNWLSVQKPTYYQSKRNLVVLVYSKKKG